MAVITTIETKYELKSMDANDNQMTLMISVSKDQAFAPEITEAQVVLAIYNRLQEGFPNNAIQANRIRTVREDDLLSNP
jgi:hypothetical protein